MGNYNQMREDILLQLQTILNSGNFSASMRMKEFLRFLVEETLAGREYQLKAYTIGREIFGRGKDFDSLTDPVVRVEAGKLRSKLNRYYADNQMEGVDLIRIEIPKGSYVPIFKRIAPHEEKYSAPEPEPGPDPTGIMVFPFYNIGKHQEVDYLISGLTEELILSLTKFEDLTVISARGLERDGHEPAGEDDESRLAARLGARFILSGNAQFVDNTIRMRINLTDTSSRKILWAEKFECSYTLENLFSIVDSIAVQTASRIGDGFGLIKRTLYKESSESARTEQIRAYEAVLSYHHWATNLAEDRFELARTALEQAIRADPGYALAYGMLSDVYATYYQWNIDPQPELLAASETLAERALALNPQSQYGLWGKAYNYFLRAKREEFLEYARKAIGINPADTYLMAVIGVKIAAAGNWQEGRELTRKALRLNPFLPDWCYTADLLYYLVNSDLEKAIQTARQVTSPSLAGPMFRIAIYGAMGRKEEALAELERVLEIQPNFKSGYKEFLHRIFFNQAITSALLNGFAGLGL